MEPLQELFEEIKTDYEKMGLYLIDFNVATTDPSAMEEGAVVDVKEKLLSGESEWIVQVSFNIGDVAWTDRVLNPEDFEFENQIVEELPTEIEAYKALLESAGGDPFKLAEMMGEVSSDEDDSDS